jgi:iron(III) transport system permease protein
MRPFNFETLATQVYQFAAAEEFGQAAIPALAIVATGVVPVILLSIAITYTRNYSEESQG